MKARRQRPLFLIDIAVPRDVERACGELESVYLYDIDDLQQIARENMAAREREIVACQSTHSPTPPAVRRLAESQSRDD